jgi:hypothetical protein
MEIQPKTLEEAMDLIYNILNQGDSRYNHFEAERILSQFLLNKAVSLEERDFPITKEPNREDLFEHFVQGQEKYIAKTILNLQGFDNSEIFYEKSFLGSRPDVFAEKGGTIIIVECCSCRISKIIDFLSEVNEIWVLTYGEKPWEKKPLFGKMQWFIFKKGANWDKIYAEFKEDQLRELKKIKSPLDNLM